MSDPGQTIIVKKVKKGGHGAHGGAWKIAYADFVTAMMAFFLLLWLLNVTTDEQKLGLSDYFSPAAPSKSESGSGGVLGGQSLQTEGAQISNVGQQGIVVTVKPPPAPGEEGDTGGTEGENPEDLTDQQLAEELAKREEKAFENAVKELRQAIQADPTLEDLANQIIIDMTPEGLRIQLVDQDGKPMFQSGGARPAPKTVALLEKVAKAVKGLPNKLKITGHTDSVPFHRQDGYSNWELSADRANASRRILVHAGIAEDRIAQVTGLADTDPLLPDEPEAAPNRRISITLLREAPVLPPEE